MSQPGLARYGVISEVARFVNISSARLSRGQQVVVRTHRGLEIAELLQDVPADETRIESVDPGNFAILRPASDEDERTAKESAEECTSEFPVWQQRLREWRLQLELIDLEWTLDRSKRILYVLNDRGAECTKLALQAAAAGLGTVEVQPVGRQGLIPQAARGGCGSGGCSSGEGSGGRCH